MISRTFKYHISKVFVDDNLIFVPISHGGALTMILTKREPF
jgi:hypothetical protein